MLIKTIFMLFLGYLLGSIPFAYIMGIALKKIDIREYGSKNVGSTNVMRVVGVLPGIMVLILDIAKGIIAVSLVHLFYKNLGISSINLIQLFVGFGVIAGHNWPIFLQFQGGKGVATSCGVFIGIAPIAVLISGIIFLIIFVLTRYVSLSSLIAASSLPIICLLLQTSATLVIFSIIAAIFIFWRHKSNIQRLIRGTENRAPIFGKLRKENK